MKFISIFSILSFSIAFVGCQKHNELSNKHENNLAKEDSLELRHIKEVLWPKSYREQDTVLLNRILDDSFQLIDGDGNRFTKQDELDWIKNNAMEHDSFRYEIKRLDIYDDMAIVAGTGHILNDKTYNIYQSSNVLVKRDSLWKAVLSHVSGYKKVEQ